MRMAAPQKDGEDATRRVRIPSVLSYMGGKTRAIPLLERFLPEGTTHLVSPFFGGGAFELHCAGVYGLTVTAADIDPWLINFWNRLQTARDAVRDACTELRLDMQHALHDPDPRDLYYAWCTELFRDAPDPKRMRAARLNRLAALFYAVNKCSYSGLTGRGFSLPCAQNRFTEAAVERLVRPELHAALSNITFQCMHYQETLRRFAYGSSVLVFVDPPYCLLASSPGLSNRQRNRLYGPDGRFHEAFDHGHFADTLLRIGRSVSWMLCYNNCDTIRDIYSRAAQRDARAIEIHELDWGYGGHNHANHTAAGRAKELLICSTPQHDQFAAAPPPLSTSSAEEEEEEEETHSVVQLKPNPRYHWRAPSRHFLTLDG